MCKRFGFSSRNILSDLSLAQTRSTPDKRGGLNGSMQHSLAVLDVGFPSLYVAPERNPKRTQPCLGLIASSGSDRLSSGSTVPLSHQRVLHRPSEPAAFIRS